MYGMQQLQPQLQPQTNGSTAATATATAEEEAAAAAAAAAAGLVPAGPEAAAVAAVAAEAVLPFLKGTAAVRQAAAVELGPEGFAALLKKVGARRGGGCSATWGAEGEGMQGWVDGWGVGVMGHGSTPCSAAGAGDLGEKRSPREGGGGRQG